MLDLDRLFLYLPRRVKEEIARICASRGSSYENVSEIRLRGVGVCSVIIRSERVTLSSKCTSADLSHTFSLLCEGSVYAKRDSIRDGYLTVLGGVRVGICGQARYDLGRLVGISDVSALVFRIPTGKPDDVSALCDAFESTSCGMLIYSAPGVGKTTALRAITAEIGKVRDGLETIVIDERCEFIPEDYKNCSVDILRGYKRAEGMEIALRTLSPTVMVVDEIGRVEEASAMLELLNCGVRIIATAHARCLSELRKRRALLPFFESGIFDTFVGITCENGVRSYVIEREGT